MNYYVKIKAVPFFGAELELEIRTRARIKIMRRTFKLEILMFC